MSRHVDDSGVESPALEASATPTLSQRLFAEFLGTFWLVLGGCGAAVLAGDKIGNLGVALAFGLTVLTGAYAFGPVSGGHFNPAVSIGLTIAKRFAWRDVPSYIAAQTLGALVAAAALFVVAHGKAGFRAGDGFATNGYGTRSPGGYDLWSVALVETVLTAFFVLVILGVSGDRAAVGIDGVAIGLALTLIHLVSIPVSNTSVNPARSLGVAVFAGSGAMQQVWLFIVAPVAGALLAGLLHALMLEEFRQRRPGRS